MNTSTIAPISKHAKALPEQLILDRLRDDRRFTVEEVLRQVPELSWAQLFLAMDILSRRGDVELRRQGFTYTLKRIRTSGSGA
ncbi:MAG: hypothetical protein GDA67_05180 [Nitrospira sp. CR1.3]|nr:hypothetical protein [Nitrospira sp. CR1.3]